MNASITKRVKESLRKIYDSLRCKKCESLLNDAVKLHCCHLCQTCGLKCVTGSASKCPVCDESVAIETVEADDAINKNIQLVKVMVDCFESATNEKLFVDNVPTVSEALKRKNDASDDFGERLKRRLLAGTDDLIASPIHYVNPVAAMDSIRYQTSTPAHTAVRPRLATNCIPVMNGNEQFDYGVSDNEEEYKKESNNKERSMPKRVSFTEKGVVSRNNINSNIINGSLRENSQTVSIGIQSSPNSCAQSQQTDVNKDDIYTRLSKLFTCLCTDRGIEGSINVEGIGRFEIKLSRPKFVANEENVEPQMPHSQVNIKISEGTQTIIETPAKSLVTQSTNTSEIETFNVHCQTSPEMTSSDNKETQTNKIELADLSSGSPSISDLIIEESQPVDNVHQGNDEFMSSLNEEDNKLLASIKDPTCATEDSLIDEPTKEETSKVLSAAMCGYDGTTEIVDFTNEDDNDMCDNDVFEKHDQSSILHKKKAKDKYKRIIQKDSSGEEESNLQRKANKHEYELTDDFFVDSDDDSLLNSPFSDKDDDCLPPTPPNGGQSTEKNSSQRKKIKVSTQAAGNKTSSQQNMRI